MGLFRGLFKAGLFVGAMAAAGYALERAAVAKLDENPDPDPGWTPKTPAGEVIKVTTTDGTVLRVLAAGEGPPLMLLHGLLVGLEVWEPAFGALVEQGHRVFACDMRGHGGSTVGTSGYRLEATGDDIKAVLEKLDLTGVILVGHSMGGMSALSFALDHPAVARDRVAGMVVVNSSAGGLMEVPQNKAQLVMIKMGLAQKAIGHPVHSTLFARPFFPPNPPASRVRALAGLWAEQSLETITGASTSLEHYDVRDRLDEVAVETLVICGTPDNVTPPEHSSLLAEGIPGARLEWLHGVGHMVQWMATDKLVDLVAQFAKERQLAG